jgi:hypothetical protein
VYRPRRVHSPAAVARSARYKFALTNRRRFGLSLPSILWKYKEACCSPFTASGDSRPML